MIHLLAYEQAELPKKYYYQVLTFLRAQWPEGFVGENRSRSWITRSAFHPRSFLLVEDHLVISHAQVVWKDLEHAGQVYKTYGITGVFTFPSFRGQGYGSQIIHAATAHIAHSDADIGMFHCDPGLAGFYSLCGWIPMYGALTWIGARDNIVTSDELMMMQFISAKGQRGRETFHREPVFFDEDTTW
jgi:GNAT superfamily N-acetyltransferase